MVRILKKPKNAKRKNKEVEGLSDSVASKVWEAGIDKLEEGEELQCDPSAYNALHAFHIGWPCMSFDVLRDSLGMVRTEFSHTAYCVAGTQADKRASNSIGIFKLSNISGKRRDLVPTKTGDDDNMDSESSDSDDDNNEEKEVEAVLQLRKVFHEGCVNRIRAMTQNPHIVASWSDTGHLQNTESDRSQGASAVSNHSPLFKFGGHKDEGYAIDWSPHVPGRLVSGILLLLLGDCKNSIHLWEPTSDTTWNVEDPFIGHSASVEDLQWSPVDPCVFASCSVDGSIKIWDTRKKRSPTATIKAYKTDVNVISWNRGASCMLASGSDDGAFSIQDLRVVKCGESVVAYFEYHKHPITSIEWSPHHEAASTIAVSSSDNQLTIWDLSLERDEEEEAEFKVKMKEQVNVPTDLPPQLLFVHQGQKDLKELHWHPQIPGMVISTAADGFNILMLSNIENVLPA
nr:glutamate-rich WD repeat-containing protein 1-like [Solanum lycopersicum]